MGNGDVNAARAGQTYNNANNTYNRPSKLWFAEEHDIGDLQNPRQPSNATHSNRQKQILVAVRSEYFAKVLICRLLRGRCSESVLDTGAVQVYVISIEAQV